MKKLILFLGFIYISSEIQAIKPGETASNFYVGGLNLRKEASKESKLLATIEYGEKVEILEITSQKFETDNLRGNWVKVKYKNKEGYLFDGYLSGLPAPDLKYIKGEAEITMKDYNDKFLGGKGKASYSEKQGSVRQSLWIPNIQTLQEGFLIAKLLNYRIFGGFKFPVSWKSYTTSNNEKITMSNNKSSLFIKIELLETSAKAFLQVKFLNGGIEITTNSEMK